MKKINCNIIRDLLPSYIDDICSEDSRLLIEEHLADCEQCCAELEMMRSTALTDEQGERKKISYLKKIKRHYNNKGMINLIFLSLVMIVGSGLMVQHYEIIGSRIFYAILPVLLVVVYSLMPVSPLSAKRIKYSWILIMAGILLIMYYFVLVYWGIQIGRTGSGLFDIPLEETGHFMQKRLIFIIAMQLCIFILSNILIYDGCRVNRGIYGLSLTGAYLAAGYIGLLHNMATVDGFYGQLLRMTGYLILEGIVFSAAAHLFAKKMIY